MRDSEFPQTLECVVILTSWGRAVPSSGQVWFVMVITDLWFLSWPSSLHRHLRKIVFSIFLLISLESNYIPKISFLACLILDIAPKKTLNLCFGRQPQTHFHCVHNISSSLVRFDLHTKISLLACLIFETLKLDDINKISHFLRIFLLVWMESSY